MAKRADQFKEDPPKEIADVKKRKQIILDAASELDRIESEIAELREEAAGIRNSKIKGHLGMKIADFNLARRLYALEGDKRSEALDTFREAFEALCPGEQLDWVEAAKKLGANGAAAEAAATH